MAALRLPLDDTLGCIFIAILFSAMLYGISCAQSILYLRHHAGRDIMVIKCLVLAAWMLDTIATTSDMSFGWFYFVQRHTDVLGLPVLPKTFVLEYAVTGCITCLVQIFYVCEIWKLYREIPLTGRAATILLPVVLSFLSLALCLVGVYVTSSHDWIITKTLPPNVRWTTTRVWTAAVADIYTTIALSWTLSKKKTGFEQSNKVINKLITYIINCGVLSTMAQIVLCATFLASIKQNKMLWLIFHTSGGKSQSHTWCCLPPRTHMHDHLAVYVNSMMAVLNARQLMRIKINRPEVYNMYALSEDSTLRSRR